MTPRPDEDNAELGQTGNQRGDSGAGDAERRRAELAKNQDVVENKVDEHRDNASLHRQHGLACLAQCAGIDLLQRKGQHLQHHHAQIAEAAVQGLLQIQRLAALVQKEADEPLAAQQQNRAEGRPGAQSHPELGPEGVSHTVCVAPAIVLGGKNARPGHAAEEAEVVHEKQLIDNGHAGHRLCAHLADHKVVQQRDKICNDVLNQHRRHHRQYPAVKRAIADKERSVHKAPRSHIRVILSDAPPKCNLYFLFSVCYDKSPDESGLLPQNQRAEDDQPVAVAALAIEQPA